MGRLFLLLNLAYLLLVNFLVKYGREILLAITFVICILGLMFLPAIGHAAEAAKASSGLEKLAYWGIVAILCLGLIMLLLEAHDTERLGAAVFMATVIAILMLFAPGWSYADDDTAVDVFKCSKVADAYSKNPFALPMKDLDDLRLCITWQMSQIQREARDAKEARAIERNFGAGRDGE